MPPENPKEETVQVWTGPLWRQAAVLRAWGEHLIEISKPLVGTTVAPGNFPAAAWFKQTVEGRIKLLLTNSFSIGHALTNLADAMESAAKSYDIAEDDKIDEAVRASKLANSVNPYLPGANSTVPVVFGATPPQPPAPIPTPDELKDPANGGKQP